MPWDPSKIPIWLRRTPEQQAADDALQARLKSAYGPGIHPSADERHLMRAVAVELSARAQLEHLDTMRSPDPLHVEVARAQLAEARADQGHFTEAAGIHPDPEQCARYEAIAAAIERPDDDECGCEPETAQTVREGKPVTVTIHPENIDLMVFDLRHHKLMPLHRCQCGALNVKPANQRLQKRLDGLKTKETV